MQKVSHRLLGQITKKPLPTAKMSSVRMSLQAAVDQDIVVHRMGVKGAYLNAPIDQELYVRQPKGFEKCNHENEELV